MKFNPKRENQIKPLIVKTANKGYIPLVEGGYNIIAGEGGTGKSLIAIKSMIIYLLDNPSKQAFMIMTEDGISECVNRAKDICRGMNKNYIDLKDRVFWQTLEDIGIPKIATKGIGGIINKDNEAIKSLCEFCLLENVGFICFDPLRAFHELDENSNNEMPSLTRDIFPLIAKITKAVILILHHSAKGEGSQVRGASSIANDARIAWVVSKVVQKSAMTKKTIIDEKFKNKLHLSIYKDNFNNERFCKIKDKDGMIDLPIKTIPVIATEYSDNINMGGIAIC